MHHVHGTLLDCGGPNLLRTLAARDLIRESTRSNLACNYPMLLYHYMLIT